MKENSIFTTGLFVVALLLLFLSVGRLLGDNDPERFKISVVVDHSNSDVWSGFKMGLTAAGRAYNMEYNFVSTDRLVSIQQESTSIISAFFPKAFKRLPVPSVALSSAIMPSAPL